MGLLTNKPPLAQAVHDRVAEPVNRLKLLPDEGVAVKAGSTQRTYGNQRDAANLWDKLKELVTDLTSFFGLDGLQANEVFCDLILRTPNGILIFPNVRLSSDQLNKSNAQDLANHLNNGFSLSVRVSYDGGRPTSVTAINWVKLNDSIESAVTQIANAPAGSAIAGTLPITLPTSGSIPSGGTANLDVNLDGHHPLKPLEAYISQAAALFAVPPAWVGAVCLTESSGNPHIGDSSANAMGPMQIIGSTFTGLYSQATSNLQLVNDPRDPRTSIFLGALYLSQLKKQFVQYDLSTAAYNAGPGNVGNLGMGALNVNGADPQYWSKVSGYWAQIQNQSAANNNTKLANRSEVQRQDGTAATAHSSSAAAGGATS